MLFLSALLALVPPQPAPVAPVVAPLPVIASRPDAAPGRILSAPDWGDYNVYPTLARQLGQSGRVRSLAVVDDQGRTIDCVIIQSSGHAELDAGHCELVRQVRYEPGQEGGRAVSSSRMISINWQLGDEYPLGRSTASADLVLVDERIVNCRLSLQGPHFLPHRLTGCLPINRNNALVASLPPGPRVRVEVEIAPAGEAIGIGKPDGRLVLRRLVAFDINGEGDAVNCRTVSEAGEVHRLAIPRGSACDDLLRSVWFAAPPAGQSLSGQYEIRLVRPR